mmetsp:Transcript_23308/g.70011  ORF Transcript_23308/g.70011 Transcript_23308/m.70011 type:complete len:229 (-) Transcript_23308:887-1573(-)
MPASPARLSASTSEPRRWGLRVHQGHLLIARGEHVLGLRLRRLRGHLPADFQLPQLHRSPQDVAAPRPQHHREDGDAQEELQGQLVIRLQVGHRGHGPVEAVLPGGPDQHRGGADDAFDRQIRHFDVRAPRLHRVADLVQQVDEDEARPRHQHGQDDAAVDRQHLDPENRPHHARPARSAEDAPGASRGASADEDGKDPLDGALLLLRRFSCDRGLVRVRLLRLLVAR